MRSNPKPSSPKSSAALAATTHEGAPAAPLTPEQALRRSVLSCLLFEGEFYEDGTEIAARILALVGEVAPERVAALAVEARSQQQLRHVPLLLVSALALVTALSRRPGGRLVEDAVADVVQRADELAELVAVHAKVNGVAPGAVKKTLSAAMKRGLARAFLKFDEYALAKYDRAGAVRLRDVLFLCHAKPDTPEREASWKRLAADELTTPDTWEVALSGGADKRETFERLIREGRLGYLALLRNLRNMHGADVDAALVEEAIRARKGAGRVLPFRFFAAAREAPAYERALDEALVASFAQMPRLGGRTIIVLDVSGSMGAPLSGRSKMTRLDAGAALAAVATSCCEAPVLYATAGNDGTRVHATARVPQRQGMALRDAFAAKLRELGGGGIFLKPMLEFVQREQKTADRIIVLTDEQDCAVDSKDSPLLAAPFGRRNYLVNVASHKQGVGYGRWTHIDGFSEGVVRYIAETERQESLAP